MNEATPAAAASSGALSAGLPVGTVFPSFRLPGLDGRDIASDDLRGKRVLLVNWSPHCGFCLRIAAELGKLKASFAAQNLTLVLAGSGDADANLELAREHGLEASVLLTHRPWSHSTA